MIPLREEIPTRCVPIVNYLLIAANIGVFLLIWLAGTSIRMQRGASNAWISSSSESNIWMFLSLKSDLSNFRFTS